MRAGVMAIKFECSNCGAVNSARDESGGTTVSCSRCAMRQRVPAPQSNEQLSTRRQPRHDRRMRVRISYSRLLGAIACVVAAVVIYTQFAGVENPPPPVADAAPVENLIMAPRRAERAAPRIVDETPQVRLPVKQRAASEPQVTKRPVGKDDPDIRRTLQMQGIDVERLEKEMAAKQPAANAIDRTQASTDPADESPPPPPATPRRKPDYYPQRWRTSITNARHMMKQARWKAAAEALTKVAKEGPEKEAAEAKTLLEQIPEAYRPK